MTVVAEVARQAHAFGQVLVRGEVPHRPLARQAAAEAGRVVHAHRAQSVGQGRRARHPVDKGRGNRVYVARSPLDSGVNFEVLYVVDKEDMDAESLERPALDVTPGGDWDLYLSCATFNSKHWRIERLRADDPASFRAVSRTVVFPGSAAFGVKDPVLVRDEDLRIWATQHPLTEGDENADRMISVNAFSGGPVMVPEPGTWYSRGGRRRPRTSRNEPEWRSGTGHGSWLWPARRPALSVVAPCVMSRPLRCRTEACVFTTKVLLSTAATSCGRSCALSVEKPGRRGARQPADQESTVRVTLPGWITRSFLAAGAGDVTC